MRSILEPVHSILSCLSVFLHIICVLSQQIDVSVSPASVSPGGSIKVLISESTTLGDILKPVTITLNVQDSEGMGNVNFIQPINNVEVNGLFPSTKIINIPSNAPAGTYLIFVNGGVSGSQAQGVKSNTFTIEPGSSNGSGNGNNNGGKSNTHTPPPKSTAHTPPLKPTADPPPSTSTALPPPPKSTSPSPAKPQDPSKGNGNVEHSNSGAPSNPVPTAKPPPNHGGNGNGGESNSVPQTTSSTTTAVVVQTPPPGNGGGDSGKPSKASKPSPTAQVPPGNANNSGGKGPPSRKPGATTTEMPPPNNGSENGGGGGDADTAGRSQRPPAPTLTQIKSAGSQNGPGSTSGDGGPVEGSSSDGIFIPIFTVTGNLPTPSVGKDQNERIQQHASSTIGSGSGPATSTSGATGLGGAGSAESDPSGIPLVPGGGSAGVSPYNIPNASMSLNGTAREPGQPTPSSSTTSPPTGNGNVSPKKGFSLKPGIVAAIIISILLFIIIIIIIYYIYRKRRLARNRRHKFQYAFSIPNTSENTSQGANPFAKYLRLSTDSYSDTSSVAPPPYPNSSEPTSILEEKEGERATYGVLTAEGKEELYERRQKIRELIDELKLPPNIRENGNEL